MKGKILELVFRGTRAYLCREKAFSLSELGLSYMISNFENPAYWTLRVIETYPDQSRIHVEIISYHSGDAKISEFQQMHQLELANFNKLSFKNVNTDGVYASANANGKYVSPTPISRSFSRVEEGENKNGESSNQPKLSEPITSKETDEFWIYFNDAQFMLGYISFKLFIKKWNQLIEFKIYNDNLLPEFENVKFWFSKVLNTNRFKVQASFKIVNNKLSDWNATSSQINSIDNEVIEGVKIQRTLEITKTYRPSEVDKALFTSDDIYSLANENDLFGNVFKQTESEIFDILLENCNVRNKVELRYLSGKIHSTNYKIRFSNHPNFGFIFLNEGKFNNHFIWELLNTNATYIWTIEKDDLPIENKFKRIENTINIILKTGRDAYKRSFKNRTIDTDLVFNAIFHKDIGSDFIDNFPRWKYKINELLT